VGDPLVLVRALHFLATMLLTGGVLFRSLVAEHALHREGQALLAPFRRGLRRLLSLSLVVALISGAAWLGILAARIGDASVGFDESAWIFLTQTQFGSAAQLRLGIALLLGVALVVPRRDWNESTSLRAVVLVASVAFAGMLAWWGHGAATPAAAGVIHTTADALHLVAAAAWLGGLVPLAGLLQSAVRRDDIRPDTLLDLLRRFSNLGLLAVATLVVSGAINTIFSIDSFDALLASSYGRLLLLKIALFAVMAAFAATNRLKWMPALAQTPNPPGLSKPVSGIYLNSLAEIALGIAIVVVVAWLGTLFPGVMPSEHMH
jgi:putative copper resistance protein D